MPNHTNRPKATCIHLFNDFSGSPKVLSIVVQDFIRNGYDVDIITSDNEVGALSNLDASYTLLPYKYHASTLKKLQAFFYFQLLCFIKCWQYPKGTVFYINTLLPFGAALAGKLRGQKVIYHLHETSLKPLALKKMLRLIAAWCATRAIYVSDFLKLEEGLKGVTGVVAYNALAEDFIQKAQTQKKRVKSQKFTVLMLCSLKRYKGVDEFVLLANQLPTIQFNLVLNAYSNDINTYFEGYDLPSNLVIFPVQKEVGWFYQNADLVLNLSLPSQWKETFGLTLLEAMVYKLPVIGPPAGGPCELISNNINGYLIHPKHTDTLSKTILMIKDDEVLYHKLSRNAELFANRFSLKNMLEPIRMQLVEGKNMPAFQQNSLNFVNFF